MAAPSPPVVIFPQSSTRVGVASEDGYDYYTVCSVHQWASLPSVSVRGGQTCPHCEADADTGGHQRYAELHNRIAVLQAEQALGWCGKCGDRGPVGATCTDCGTGRYLKGRDIVG